MSQHSTMETWTWRCLPCGRDIQVPIGDAPTCTCVAEPYFVPLQTEGVEPREHSSPDARGDAEDRVLLLVDRHGGRFVTAKDPRRPDRPSWIACWRPPRDGQVRIGWIAARIIAYRVTREPIYRATGVRPKTALSWTIEWTGERCHACLAPAVLVRSTGPGLTYGCSRHGYGSDPEWRVIVGPGVFRATALLQDGTRVALDGDTPDELLAQVGRSGLVDDIPQALWIGREVERTAGVGIGASAC